MPAYNASRFIRQAIASVLAQTFADYELIIVNDGSTDNTLEIIKSFNDPRIRVFSQTNEGRGPARARAMRLAHGEFVAFLDADDLWEPDMLASCIAILEAVPDAGLVHTNWRYVDEKGNKSSQPSRWQPWRGDVLDRLILGFPFITSGVVVRRQALAQAGLLDEDTVVLDDWDMWLLLSLSGCQFECVDMPLVYYRRHDSNITHNYELFFEDQKRTLDIFFARPTVPLRVRALKGRAYARVYLVYAISLLRDGKYSRALMPLQEALSLDPTLLNEPSTYFEIAASGQPIGKNGPSYHIDLTHAEKSIQVLLCAAGELDECAKEITFRAYNALSQVAYWQANDSVARQKMLQAIAAGPLRLSEFDTIKWVLRLLLGAKTVQCVQRLRKRHDTSVGLTKGER